MEQFTTIEGKELEATVSSNKSKYFVVDTTTDKLPRYSSMSYRQHNRINARTRFRDIVTVVQNGLSKAGSRPIFHEPLSLGLKWNFVA